MSDSYFFGMCSRPHLDRHGHHTDGHNHHMRYHTCNLSYMLMHKKKAQSDTLPFIHALKHHLFVNMDMAVFI